MRIVTSIMLAAIVLTLPLSVIAAPSQQASIDIKSLALTKADLQWRGFEQVPDRTVSEDRNDGVAVYDITFARERSSDNLSSGPFEIRSGVARTAAVDDAMLQLDSTKEAFLGEGWTETGVPPLGDDALGLTQTTDGDGGKIAHFSYLFRKGAYIMMIGVRGRPEVTKLNDAVSLAIVVSGRLDKALAGGAPPASGAAAAPGATASGSTTRQGTGERVRVINAEGGSVNMRAEPSTSAAVVTQVAEGATLDVVGPNRDAEGRTWRNVQTGDRQTGWIASTFVETIAAPPAAPSPSPAPVRPAATSTATPEAGQPAGDGNPAAASTEATAEASPSPSPSPSPSASASASATVQTTPAASASANTFRGSGNGLEVEGFIRDLSLSSGKQQVKVKVTRGGGGVGDAFVNITARLDAKRFRAIKADRTNQDGYTEVEWDMEGPPGTYEVLIEVKTAENGPATSAKGTFRWRQ